MRKPRLLIKPLGILNISFPFVVLLYLLLGIAGYFKYGEDVHTTILQNFPVSKYKLFFLYYLDLNYQIPKFNFIRWVIFIKLAYAVSTIISYSLQGYCIIIITWTNFLKQKVKMVSKHFIYEMFLRNCIVVLSCK